MTSKDSIVAFLAEAFPQAASRVVAVGNGGATVRREIGAADLRPGGTVSGPVLMATADEVLYAAVLGAIGIVPLAVTTSLNISFLRKPAADSPNIARCRRVKVGRTLAVGEMELYSEGSPRMVALATGTYSIPPRDHA